MAARSRCAILTHTGAPAYGHALIEGKRRARNRRVTMFIGGGIGAAVFEYVEELSALVTPCHRAIKGYSSGRTGRREALSTSWFSKSYPRHHRARTQRYGLLQACPEVLLHHPQSGHGPANLNYELDLPRRKYRCEPMVDCSDHTAIRSDDPSGCPLGWRLMAQTSFRTRDSEQPSSIGRCRSHATARHLTAYFPQ